MFSAVVSFGFDPLFYSTNENVGNLALNVSLSGDPGSLSFQVFADVDVSSAEATATGM